MGTEREQAARDHKAKQDTEARERRQRIIVERAAKRRADATMRAKIAAVLGMLGSDHDGEVAAAGRQALNFHCNVKTCSDFF
jgi:hypothetical protein